MNHLKISISESISFTTKSVSMNDFETDQKAKLQHRIERISF